MNRSAGQDPAPGSGVIAEVRPYVHPSQNILVSPGVMGFNNDNPSSGTIYLRVWNQTSSTNVTITVTLTVLKIGD